METINKTDINEWLVKRIKKLRTKVEVDGEKYNGNEENYTFHGGFTYGYSHGKLSALEDFADTFGINIDDI